MNDRERRKLDGEVAEQVMGWHGIGKSHPDAEPGGWPPKGHRLELPRYTTDASTAMQVVERLESLGFEFVIKYATFHLTRRSEMQWTIVCEGHGKIAARDGYTMAEAICDTVLDRNIIAALAVVKSKGDDDE